MKTTAYPVPAEEHDGEESGFEKESEQTFDGQRSSENIPDKPGIIRPVGTELEFQYQSRSYTDGEVVAKSFIQNLVAFNHSALPVLTHMVSIIASRKDNPRVRGTNM